MISEERRREAREVLDELERRSQRTLKAIPEDATFEGRPHGRKSRCLARKRIRAVDTLRQLLQKEA